MSKKTAKCFAIALNSKMDSFDVFQGANVTEAIERCYENWNLEENDILYVAEVAVKDPVPYRILPKKFSVQKISK